MFNDIFAYLEDTLDRERVHVALNISEGNTFLDKSRQPCTDLIGSSTWEGIEVCFLIVFP